MPTTAPLPTTLATFLRGYGIAVRALGPTRLRVRRPGGRLLVLAFEPGWANLADIRVTVSAGPWDPKTPNEWLEELHGRHSINGDPSDPACLGHQCLNAINAHSFERAA